jgi:hypothetical protein
MPLEHSVYFQMKEAGSGRPVGCCVKFRALDDGSVDWHDVRAFAADLLRQPDERGKVPGTIVQHDSAAVVSGWRRYVRRIIGRPAA